MMAADTMEALGVPRGAYVVKLNNRKVLDGVLEVIGLDGENNASTPSYCSSRDRQVRSAWGNGVRQLLAEGRKDESGDFTKGAGLDADCCRRGHEFVFEQAADAGDKDRSNQYTPRR